MEVRVGGLIRGGFRSPYTAFHRAWDAVKIINKYFFIYIFYWLKFFRKQSKIHHPFSHFFTFWKAVKRDAWLSLHAFAESACMQGLTSYHKKRNRFVKMFYFIFCVMFYLLYACCRYSVNKDYHKICVLGKRNNNNWINNNWVMI